jgi:hypothetical protein
MSSNATFHIIIDTKVKGRFRMEVEHVFSSPQVERFKIKGQNNRFVLMEKRLNLKRQPWKVTQLEMSSTNYTEAAMALRDMQDAIDAYLEEKRDHS